MGKDTSIGWTDHTFSPWWGCVRVSPGCEHCYAEAFSKRVGLKVWGQKADRRFMSDKYWDAPLKWDRAAQKDEERRRVFCSSMADVFEDRPDLEEHRWRLWKLIERTPHLDWLLLTKRPENHEMVPMSWMTGSRRPSNVWLGCTAEDQRRADERIPHLMRATWPAVKFVSYEPALEAVNFSPWLTTRETLQRFEAFTPEAKAAYPVAPTELVRGGIDWLIVGGESGPKARPFDIEWARSAVRQCRESGGTACFVKQMGSVPITTTGTTGRFRTHEGRRQVELTAERLRLQDRKGSDVEEFPDDLRVREFPTAKGPTP